MSAKVKEIIVNQIIEAVEAGHVLPWMKPWTPNSGPANAITGRAYSGINPWLCQMSAMKNGYTSRYWITAKQCKEKKLSFAGQKATQIIWASIVQKTDKDGFITGESFFTMRYYNVFNVDQIPGAAELASKHDKPRPTIAPIDAAEAVVNHMPNAPKITHSGTEAFYSPPRDFVNMPPRDDFHTAEGYYDTLFHELAHSTGHSSRLNRGLDTKLTPRGSADYSKEELIAEMTGAILCGETGISNEGLIKNSTAYIGGWLKSLKDDHSLLFQAAAAAQRAADYILDTPKDAGSE